MKRARHHHQKAERREAILSAALAILKETPFADITMTQVSSRLGLVKGTLYLYFSTKEELFLEVLRDQIHGWFWDLETGLETLPRRGRLTAAARLIAATTASRPGLKILFGILNSTLEGNIPDSTAQAFHQEWMSRIKAMGLQLEKALPFLQPDQGTNLLLDIQALLIGWQTLAAGSPTGIIQPMPRPEFETAFRSSLEVLLQGFREAHRQNSAQTAPA